MEEETTKCDFCPAQYRSPYSKETECMATMEKEEQCEVAERMFKKAKRLR